MGNKQCFLLIFVFVIVCTSNLLVVPVFWLLIVSVQLNFNFFIAMGANLSVLACFVLSLVVRGLGQGKRGCWIACQLEYIDVGSTSLG